MNYTIHDLPPEDRPRERLQELGVDNLSIQELLAIIIQRGTKNKNVLTIAQDLLAHFGNLKNIKQASLQELQIINGVGLATASKLQAAFQLGQKAQADHKRYGQKIETPKDVFNLFKNTISDKKKEHFNVLSLGSRSHLLDINKVSIGTVNTTLSHPREVFQFAIKNSATSIILVHNHPSGDSSPSHEDIEHTESLKKAGKLLKIKLKDHIIITSNSYFSFRENSIL